MINLLPLEEKRNIAKEKTQKIIVILFIVLFFSFVDFSLMLFFIKIYSSSQVNYYELMLEKSKRQFQESEIQEIEKEITELDSLVAVLSNFYSQEEKIKATNIIEKITETVPTSISLRSVNLISVEEEGVKKIKISISGYSPHVSYLVDFKKSLLAEKLFREVSFPASNFINNEDIDFSATLSILYEN